MLSAATKTANTKHSFDITLAAPLESPVGVGWLLVVPIGVPVRSGALAVATGLGVTEFSSRLVELVMVVMMVLEGLIIRLPGNIIFNWYTYNYSCNTIAELGVTKLRTYYLAIFLSNQVM